MASISARPRRDGSTAWRVNFRTVPGGPPTSETFESAEDAQYFARLVDRIGGRAAREKRSAAHTQQAPALTKILDAYIAQAPDLTAATAAEYRRILDRSGISARMGDLPINLIDREDVVAWVRERAGTPTETTGAAPSPKTIRNEHGLLSTLLGFAAEEGHITVNPAKGVRLPAKKAPEKRLLTDEEFLAIHAKIRPRYQPFVRWLAVTGMRWGEATAIQWRDIRKVGGHTQVTVARAWKHGTGTGADSRTLGVPKTERGVRTIAIPPELVAELGDRGAASDYVFTTERGNPIWHPWFHTRVWRPAIEAAEVSPPPKLHDLRRYCAATLLAVGVPMHVVSARLGHEKITTTVDLYGYLTPDMMSAGMERMTQLVTS